MKAVNETSACGDESWAGDTDPEPLVPLVPLLPPEPLVPVEEAAGVEEVAGEAEAEGESRVGDGDAAAVESTDELRHCA